MPKGLKPGEQARQIMKKAREARKAHIEKWGGTTRPRTEELEVPRDPSQYGNTSFGSSSRSSWGRGVRLAEERTPKWWRK